MQIRLPKMPMVELPPTEKADYTQGMTDTQKKVYTIVAGLISPESMPREVHPFIPMILPKIAEKIGNTPDGDIIAALQKLRGAIDTTLENL